jgi:hypothetical protein
MEPKMKSSLRRLALLPVLALLLAGCSSKVQIASGTHPGQLHHIFVEHLLSDGHNVDELIARELRRLGYDASAGAMTMMPDGTEAIIDYQPQWAFDLSTYIFELDLAVRDAKSGKEIAVSKVVRPSLTSTDPNEIVRRAIDKIFPPK